MQRKILFLKLFSLILFVFLWGCTQTQPLNQDEIVATSVSGTLSAIPTNTPIPTFTPDSSLAQQEKVATIVANTFAESQKKSPMPPYPAIGMTKEEVKNSNWGTPNKINRTTTEYSVSEQWVYTSRGYIYLDDGIVTAIQD